MGDGDESAKTDRSELDRAEGLGAEGLHDREEGVRRQHGRLDGVFVGSPPFLAIATVIIVIGNCVNMLQNPLSDAPRLVGVGVDDGVAARGAGRLRCGGAHRDEGWGWCGTGVGKLRCN